MQDQVHFIQLICTTANIINKIFPVWGFVENFWSMCMHLWNFLCYLFLHVFVIIVKFPLGTLQNRCSYLIKISRWTQEFITFFLLEV